MLVLNALRIEPHYSHLNLDEALKIVDLLKPKRTYFTHISHFLGFHDECSKQLPKNVYLAYDNLKIQIKLIFNEKKHYTLPVFYLLL